MALSSSSFTKPYLDSPHHSRRLISSTGSRTKVELHQVDVQLQKEFDRLERQQNAAVSNIANHQQAMKMSWRKLEQKRAAESNQKVSSKETIYTPPNPRRGIFHSNTKLSAEANVWQPEGAPPLVGSLHSTPTTVTVTGDVHHRRFAQVRGPPSSSNRIKSSPYLSSPFNMRRQVPVSMPSKLAEGSEGLPSLSSSPPVAMSNQDVSDKNTLLRASKLMGVEPSASQGPQSFKEFYATSGNIERSTSAASVLVSSALEQSLSASQMKTHIQKSDEEKEPKTDLPADEELTVAQMFDQIKHCRYIRQYHPDGTALEEYS